MSVLDVSKVRIEGKAGPFGIAQLRGESLPATFSMDDSIADPYRLDPVKLTESHASALDFVTATRARELMGIMRQGLDSSIDGPVLPGKISGG